MVWFRVDDNLSDHPKVLTAGNAAMGLWVRAGAWSMKHLTDGYVPGAVVALLGTAKEAQSLVTSGLWLVADGGYRFHAWEGRQPTKDAVEDRRQVRAEAGRKGGIRSGESRRQANGEANASPVVEANANPVPSRPDPTQTTTDSGDTHRPVTKVDARADETDEEFITREAAGLGIRNLDRVMKALGGDLSPAEAIDAARSILAGSTTHVRYPEAYIERAVTG